MSTIGGVKRELNLSDNNFSKKVGLFEANVIAINPTREEFKNKLGIEMSEDSKAIEYLGQSADGNDYLRIDVWLQDTKTKENYKITPFFLEDKERENKDGSKKQYINSVGVCSWASDENDLPDWFISGRDHRVAYTGEEIFYNFMKSWLSKLDYRSAETTLQLEWKKLMKGNIKDLKDQINGEWSDTIVSMATVITKMKDGEVKEYQGVYNKSFLPLYSLKQFRVLNYDDRKTQQKLINKKSKELSLHEKFVVNIIGEYGCKDYYLFKELQSYNSDDNLVSTDSAISDGGDDY